MLLNYDIFFENLEGFFKVMGTLGRVEGPLGFVGYGRETLANPREKKPEKKIYLYVYQTSHVKDHDLITNTLSKK